jgi:hypothetical protein
MMSAQKDRITVRAAFKKLIKSGYGIADLLVEVEPAGAAKVASHA